MDNIDDLMRKKFDSDQAKERFEFQEEFWEQAQALLEQEETHRRKRGWWWMRWALALGLALLLIWCLWKPTELGRRWSDGSTNANPDGMSNGMSSQQNPTMDHHSDAAAPANGVNETLSSDHSAPISGASKDDLSASNTPTNGSNTSIKAQKDVSVQTLVNGKNGQKAFKTAKNSSKSGALTSKSANAAQNSAPFTAASPENNNRLGAESANSAKQANSLANPSQKSSTPVLSERADPNGRLETNPLGANNNPRGIEKTSSENTQTNPENFDFFRLISPTTPLPNPIEPLILPENRPNTPLKTQATTQPIAQKPMLPKNKRRVSMGLALAGTAYKVPTGESWAGGLVGLSGTYRLNKDWALGLGVQGRYIPGQTPTPDGTFPAEVSYLRFSFGFEQETWTRKNIGLYGVEVPISIQWSREKWSFEGGTTLGWLVAIQDEATYTSISSLDSVGAKVATLNVKGDQQLYQPRWATAFVGAQYRLTSRLSLTGRVQQRFQALYKNAANEGNRSKLGYFDLGLRIRLY